MKFEDPYETEVTEFEFNSYNSLSSKNHSFLQNRIGGLLDFKYRKEYSVLTAIDLELTTGGQFLMLLFILKWHLIGKTMKSD